MTKLNEPRSGMFYYAAELKPDQEAIYSPIIEKLTKLDDPILLSFGYQLKNCGGSISHTEFEREGIDTYKLSADVLSNLIQAELKRRKLVDEPEHLQFTTGIENPEIEAYLASLSDKANFLNPLQPKTFSLIISPLSLYRIDGLSQLVEPALKASNLTPFIELVDFIRRHDSAETVKQKAKKVLTDITPLPFNLKDLKFTGTDLIYSVEDSDDYYVRFTGEETDAEGSARAIKESLAELEIKFAIKVVPFQTHIVAGGVVQIVEKINGEDILEKTTFTPEEVREIITFYSKLLFYLYSKLLTKEQFAVDIFGSEQYMLGTTKSIHKQSMIVSDISPVVGDYKDIRGGDTAILHRILILAEEISILEHKLNQGKIFTEARETINKMAPIFRNLPRKEAPENLNRILDRIATLLS